ncbi:MAG: hypothetical protein L3J88_01060 [Gammaproteobacteria bacterium]|nr:hypothetical protein [Gammaproteobacteria bacterium]MCF6361957.1 hypothetical protein [Gammaproteobacteria bacterium]
MKHYPLPRLSRLIPLIAVLLLSGVSQAGMITGYVYTRAPVLSEAGHFIWAEYAPDSGEFISELAEAAGDWAPEQWRVLSGAEYQTYIDQYQALIDRHPGLEAPLSRSAYESAIFYLADGITEMSKPALKHPGTAYVSVLPQSVRYLDDPGSLVLDEYPVDPTDTNAPNNASMLVRYNGSPRGEIKAATPNRLGFRTAFIKDRDGNVLDVPDRWFEQGMKRRPGQGVVGPISNVVVEGLMMGRGASVSDGKYVTMWHSIPCPIIPYSIDGYATATLRYRRFDPRAQGFDGVYFVMRPLVESCQPDFFMVPFFGPFPLGLGTVTTYPLMMDFPIDVMVLSGVAQMPVPVGQTQYRASDPDHDIPQGNPNYYDFDDDGLTDTIILGRFETDADSGEEIFVLGTDGIPEDLQRQGVFLSSSGAIPGEDLPDLTRVIDRASFDDLRPQGLLSEISAEDLRNTDLYVVRVADGRLIAERIGLNEYEADRISNFGENAESSQFFYSLQMRNSFGDLFRYASGGFRPVGLNFSKWQSTSGINPALHQRQADHLQPGDLIRLYAINRATGYLGVTTTVMQAAGSDGLANLAFRIDPIQMRPPNLKIWAERGYDIQAGLRKGDIEQDQVIGYEGAALTSDNYLKITTEWLDPQGRPLPSALQGAGYTGRIAILSSDKTLANNNQGVYQFAIEPGQHLQVLQLPNNLATDQQHYYLHVSGEPQSGNPIFTGTDNVRIGVPDFSSSGQNPGILEKRPDNYVPFLVPVFDETGSELQRRVYRQMKRDNPEQAFTKPEPIYRWAYRPEFQFSNYQLTMKEMRAENYAADGSLEDSADLLNVETPVLSSDNLLSLLYNLETTELLPLDYLNAGPEKELIFTLGEQEVKVTLGTDQTLRFEDLSHLSSLDPEDYLTLRLYANNDMGNVLWAWAFANFGVYPENEIEVSADDQFAYIVGLVGHPDGSIVDWQLLTGSGSLSESQTPTIDNSAVVKLNTSSNPGDTYRVRGILRRIPTGSGTQSINAKRESAMLKVVAGVPANITIDKSKNIYRSDNTDTVELTATVRDQFGNLVENETPVMWLVENSTSEFLAFETHTTSGVASATLKAPKTPINQVVTVRAGRATQTVIMDVERVSGNLTSSRAELSVDFLDTATLTATVNAAEGTPVFWLSSNGSVVGETVVSGGTATATLSSAGGSIGPVVVTATIGDRLLFWEGMFTTSSPLTAAVAHPVVVAGESVDGIETVTWADGTTRNIRYWASTPIELTGPPNADLLVGFRNDQTTEAFTFDALDASGIIQGQIAGHSMTVTGGTLDTLEKRHGLGSLRFSGTGNGTIPDHASFNFSDTFSVSMSVRPAVISPALLAGKGAAWTLEMLSDGRIQASLTTNQGTFSSLSSQALSVDEWTEISLQYDADGLRVNINNSTVSTSATGNVISSTESIVIASDLAGHIDDLRFSNRMSSAAVARLDGVDAAGRVQLNAAGQATIHVRTVGEVPGAGVSRRVPISIRSLTPIVKNNGFSFFRKAYADNDETTTYVQVVEKDWWFYTYDSVTSFFGADPESGVGTASNVAGGMLIVADIGSIVKNLWRTTGWTDKEPNWVEFSLSLAGLATEIAVGAGEIADAPISATRAVVAGIGDTPFTRVLATRLKAAVTGDLTIGAAEKGFLTKLAQGDEALSSAFNGIVKSPETYEAAIRAADSLGDEFFDVVKQIASDPSLGFEGGEAVVKALAGVSDGALAGIKNSSVPLSTSLTGLAQAGKQVSPELLTKVIGNDNLYSAGYKQGDLLKDMGELADVRGFDLLADALATGNKNGLKSFPQGKGFRYELESAAYIKRNGGEVIEISKKLSTSTGQIKTDIDIIANLGAGPVYVQVKRSTAALQYGKKGLERTQTWIKKAQKDMGVPLDDFSKILYVVPPNTRIPPLIEKFFRDEGITVLFDIPHL